MLLLLASCSSSVLKEQPVVLRPVPVWLDGLRNGCASGLATVCAKSLLQPFDTVKTLQQARAGAAARGMLGAFAAVVGDDGFGALYRGLGVALFGSVPAISAYFAVYSSCKRTLAGLPPLEGRRMLVVAISAALANSVAATLRVPCEVVKQRLQAGVYPSVGVAWAVLREQGLRGLYVRGALASQLARDLPFGIIMFLGYESLRGAFQRRCGGERPTPWLGALCGAAAGAVATLATMPLDVLKTRVMTGRAANGGLLAAATAIVRAEGAAALYRGALPRLLHKIPASGLFWLLYESFRALLRVEVWPGLRRAIA